MVVKNLDNGLNGINGSGIVVKCFRRVSTGEEGVVVLVTAAFAIAKVEAREVEGGESGAIAAAEFVLVSTDGEGELSGGKGGGGRGSGAVVVVVKHEIANGFAGDFATFHHEIEVEHEFALGDAFTEKEISNTNQIPNLFCYHWKIIIHFWICNFELVRSWILNLFFVGFLRERERERWTLFNL